MLGWLRRYRHGRGFGIHSPFAYRFIMEVLEEKLPYYDYVHLPTEQQRLVYRIAAFLQPAKVRLFGDADISPILMACERSEATAAADWQLAVAAAPCTAESVFGDRVDGCVDDCVVVLTGPHHSQSLADFKAWLAVQGCGMTFDNERDTAIIVFRRKLPRQDFTARF